MSAMSGETTTPMPSRTSAGSGSRVITAARRHQDERVTPLGHMRDDVPLLAAKSRVAEDIPENLIRA